MPNPEGFQPPPNDRRQQRLELARRLRERIGDVLTGPVAGDDQKQKEVRAALEDAARELESDVSTELEAMVRDFSRRLEGLESLRDLRDLPALRDIPELEELRDRVAKLESGARTAPDSPQGLK